MADSEEFESEFFDPEAEGGKGAITEAAKRLLAFGVSAAFVTEETLKQLVRDLKLPREVIQGLLKGAGKSKQEMLDKISTEVVRMISKIDFVKEASRFVETHKFQITAEVNVIRKDTGEREFVVSSKVGAPERPGGPGGSGDPHIEIK